MENYISLKKSNCKDCYKCIRNCPVKSIRFSDHQAQIIEDECILCGICFVSCPQNAKVIRDDTSKVIEAINQSKHVYACFAPSFVANYPGYTISSMDKAVKALGFIGAKEVALGASVVKDNYDELCRLDNQDVIISSCCHTVNLLIEKHYKKALPYLAHVLSPMQVTGKMIKEEDKDAFVVFIGPCISKKAEAHDYPGIIDVALTFEEFTQLLEKKGVSFTKEEDSFKGKSRLFPTTGGILKSMLCDQKDYTYMAVDGVNNCISVLEDILKGNVHHCFIEMSSCVGSCINGPAMDRKSIVSDYISVMKSASCSDFGVDVKFDTYKEMKPNNIIEMSISDQEIEDILLKMNKDKKEKELNCGSCGYNSCRDKARAVAQGKADISMCLPYLKEKAESFGDNIIRNSPTGIVVLNESFEIQLINQAACNIVNVKRMKDVIGMPVVQILEPDSYIYVENNHKSVTNKRVYLSEYDRTILESVIYDETYHIVIGFMRDITIEETTKQKKDDLSKQTIEITDKVIEKQMRVVQEIASLLGETTAETKVALTKLKDSLKND